MEIEGTQVASILLGSTGFTSSHKFWNLYLSAAMIHVREKANLIKISYKEKIASDVMMEQDNSKNDDIISKKMEIDPEIHIDKHKNLDENEKTDLHIEFNQLYIDAIEGVQEYKKGYTQEDVIETSSKNYQSKDLLEVKNEQTNVDQNDNIPQSQDVDEIINENYPYVDIDELTSIDIMESHMRENNDYDRGLREIVYDADKNVILLMQHDYYR